MLGVIVWSRESAQTAVVWCEDHGEIAYLKGYEGLAEQPDYLSPDPVPPRWPAVGDLVSLDISAGLGLRLASNLAILEAEWGAALPCSLIEAARAIAPEGIGPDPAPRRAWRPEPPAFPPAPFAPVPARQGMMPPANPPAPASAPADAQASPVSASPGLVWPRRGRA